MPKRPSPDSVVLIDLSLDDDEQEARLGDVRKVLEPPSVKKSKKRAAGLKTTGLDDEDDDDEVIVLEEAPPSWKISPTKVKKEGAKVGRRKTDNKPSGSSSGVADDVEIVEGAAPTLVVPPRASTTETDDDVVLEGVVNEQRLPHNRHDCTVYPFMRIAKKHTTKEVFAANKKFCDLCYCFACDCPAKDCNRWCPPQTRTSERHCCAEDTPRWTRVRMELKAAKDRRTTSPASAASTESSISPTEASPRPPLGYHYYRECSDHFPCSTCWCFVCDKSADDCESLYRHRDVDVSDQRWIREREQRKLSTYGEQGPFAPDSADAPKDGGLTKCRSCGWFSRLSSRDVRHLSVCSLDWCKQCGRVASEEDFGRFQRKDLTENTAVDLKNPPICLGTREIPFRIKAHDPRRFPEYQSQWEDADTSSPQWTYDDADREEEVFHHLIGKHPRLRNVVYRIAIVPEDKVVVYPCDSVTADMTDSILIDVVQHIHLLDALQDMPDSTCKVSASWDKVARSGIFKIQLYLESDNFVESAAWCHPNYEIHPELLGLWFEDIFPFPLEEICGSLEVEREPDIESFIRYSWLRKEIALPFEPLTVDIDSVLPAAKKELYSGIDSFCHKHRSVLDKLTLHSSNSSRYDGNICDADISLRGSLMRYFREMFPSMVDNSITAESLVMNYHGQISTVNHCGSEFEHVVGFKAAMVARACLSKDALSSVSAKRKYMKNSKCIGQLMVRLENLGHKSAEYVEGLTIDLLDFQRQTLQWALEREQVPGGIQSFLWPKLPSCDERKDLYYNPILNRFRKDRPALVRGGIICEQMGLGKTIISLALILKNPAPDIPASGSCTSNLANAGSSIAVSPAAPSMLSDDCGWDKELYRKTSTENKKRGSILSRGTLVICPVSLVGQWIEEATAKLQEPGLIYPYHGQNRTRNAAILAMNTIVVTTYQVLASDANYHKKKKDTIEGDYCPPCEQVRWWRIIADEGHCLRHSSTHMSKAVCSLVADHKWVVTGTPCSTSVMDLKNQIRFLGVEYIEKMFKQRLPSSPGESDIDVDLLMCMLRPMLIRHSQAQKYRNAETTLMSLPAKKERTVTVKFSDSEKIEFDKIEKQAQDFYLNFRALHKRDMSKHFLKVSQKLMPLRVASAGGRYPLSIQSDLTDDDEDLDPVQDATEVDISEEQKSKKRSSTKVVYSDFVFQSKFHVLMSILRKIRDKEPTAKSLIFSQFTSTLDWLKDELPKHGFQFRTLSGDMSMKLRAKALHDFQQDPPTTIFLLSIRAGAVGINLTQANRVFLMEPSFNPALEAQAIGRVHRLGQKHAVKIYRLIGEGFESRMVRVMEKKFGSNAVTTENGDESKEGNSDHKSAAVTNIEKKPITNEKVAPADVLVGNLRSDKTQIMIDEFDVLFGVENLVDEPEDMFPNWSVAALDSNVQSGEARADAVLSSAVL